MTVSMLLGHGDTEGATRMGAGTAWMVLSMIAFSLFLLAFAWSLLRPVKRVAPTSASVAAERYARGEIDGDDFERILRNANSGQP